MCKRGRRIAESQASDPVGRTLTRSLGQGPLAAIALIALIANRTTVQAALAPNAKAGWMQVV